MSRCPFCHEPFDPTAAKPYHCYKEAQARARAGGGRVSDELLHRVEQLLAGVRAYDASDFARYDAVLRDVRDCLRVLADAPAPPEDEVRELLAEVMRERDELRAEIAKHWDCPLSPAPRAAWTRQDWYKHAQADMEGLVVRIDTWVCEGGEMPALLKLLGDLRTFLARQPAQEKE